MTKKMREIEGKIEAKTKEADELFNSENPDIENGNKLLEEIDNLKKQFEGLEKLETMEKDKIQKEVTPETSGKVSKDSITEFAKAARMQFSTKKTMEEGTGSKGGYTVPEDIVTAINERKTSKFSLLDLVDVETVSTDKGSRTYKKRSQRTGFALVNEKGKIGLKSTPQFELLEFAIKKYAGIFAVTNELFDDSDANIANFIINEIGDESRVTSNILILEALKTKDEIEFTNFAGIKTSVNTGLGQAFKSKSSVITNDDGFNWLDTLTDGLGRPLLDLDKVNGKPAIKIGGEMIPVTAVPTADLPNTNVYTASEDTSVQSGKVYYTRSGSEGSYVYTKVETPTGNPKTSNYYEVTGIKAPVIIGELKEAIKYFDRKKITIKASDDAVIGSGDDTINAYEQDLTLFRAIEREDVQVKDDEAYINGYIDLLAVAE